MNTPFFDIDYYVLGMWLAACTYLAGKGLSGLIRRDLHISALRGGNVDRRGKSAVILGGLFFIGFWLFALIAWDAFTSLFGFFNPFVYIAFACATVTFWLGRLPRQYPAHTIPRTIFYIFCGVFILFIMLYRINELTGGSDVWDREDFLKREAIEYQNNYSLLFSEVMPQFKRCKEIGNTDTLSNLCGPSFAHRMADLALPERTNIYFIQLCDGDRTICKLFKSGDFRITKIQTNREKRVRKLLEGMQTTVTDNFRINEQYTAVQYLFDLYSEAEIIVPVISQGKVIGAIVEVYGD